MKFMITWNLPPAHQKAAVARFLETGGMPSEGVKMLGRWHAAGSGFVLAEAGAAEGIYEWLAHWTDLMTFSVTPVVEDAAAASILKKLG